MLELFLAVATGATMVIVPPCVYGGDELAEVFRSERVTHAFITPAALASMDPSGLDDLTVVGVGGEAYSPELISKWTTGDGSAASASAPRTFLNVYGPDRDDDRDERQRSASARWTEWTSAPRSVTWQHSSWTHDSIQFHWESRASCICPVLR